MPKKDAKTANGGGSIRKRPDGTWEARYTVGFDAGTGKQIRKSIYGKTQKEVKQRLVQALADINNKDYFEPSKLTVKRWVEIWLAEYMGDKKYSTVKHYKAVCNTHIIPALGAVKLSELTTPQVQKFYNSLSRKGKAPKTVKNIHVILQKCLETAVEVGYIKDNVARRATLPKVIKKEIRPLTDEQVKSFLLESDKDELGTALKVILFTGFREAEALGLTWDCIDFNKGTIRIYQQLQKRPIKDGGYTLAPLKNEKPRLIKPAPFVIQLLKGRQTEQLQQRFIAADAWDGFKNQKEQQTSLVFTNAIGKPINPKVLYLHYKKIAERIGAPESRVHDLRHTFAVLSLQNGDDVKTVQENLGHATAAFTLDVYGHVSERMRDESSSRMDAYIKHLAAE